MQYNSDEMWTINWETLANILQSSGGGEEDFREAIFADMLTEKFSVLKKNLSPQFWSIICILSRINENKYTTSFFKVKLYSIKIILFKLQGKDWLLMKEQ